MKLFIQKLAHIPESKVALLVRNILAAKRFGVQPPFRSPYFLPFKSRQNLFTQKVVWISDGQVATLIRENRVINML